MRGRPGKLHGWGATASSPLGVHILGDLDMQQSDTGCLCISPGFASVVDSHTGCSVKSSCLAHAWVCYIKRIHVQCRNYWEPHRDGTAVALAAAELCFWRWQWKKYQMDTAEDRAVNAATARLVEVGNWFFFSVPWDKTGKKWKLSSTCILMGRSIRFQIFFRKFQSSATMFCISWFWFYAWSPSKLLACLIFAVLCPLQEYKDKQIFSCRVTS